jgi:hypothetical protein
MLSRSTVVAVHGGLTRLRASCAGFSIGMSTRLISRESSARRSPLVSRDPATRAPRRHAMYAARSRRQMHLTECLRPPSFAGTGHDGSCSSLNDYSALQNIATWLPYCSLTSVMNLRNQLNIR